MFIIFADDSPLSLQPVEEDNGLINSTVVCSDVGLKCLSQKLLSKRVTDIGHCLGLHEILVQRIEEDTTHDDQHKMHQLLKEWKHSTEPATWGMLAHSFRSLEDDSLMKKLTQAASEEQNPKDQGMAGAYDTNMRMQYSPDLLQ